MLVFEGFAATTFMPIGVICTSNRGRGDIPAQAADKDHVCAYGSIAVGVNVDIHDLCYH